MSPEELREQVSSELPETPIVVALGGGADSAVAAWACAPHPAVRGVFVDHELDGSATLRATAVKLAEFVDLQLTVLSAPVADGSNLESRARDARWRAIEANLEPDEIVVTGHSRDDLVETVLMNLLRGAGSGGLAAMAASRAGLLRPLRGFDRSELRAIAESLGLPFADDPANLRTDLLRNRIRSDLVPSLDREYQAGVRVTLARAASHLAADDAQLQVAADRVPIRDDEGAILLPVPVLRTVPRPVAARAVRRALREVNPPYAGSSSDVVAVMDIVSGESRKATLTGGLTAAREGPYVAVWASAASIPAPVRLEAPGVAHFGRRTVSADLAANNALAPSSIVLVDPDIFGVALVIRAADHGERIDIDGGTKLIRDALAESGVPARKRAAWPVLAEDARIAAIVAGRVAPWARPSGDRVIAITQEWT